MFVPNTDRGLFQAAARDIVNVVRGFLGSRGVTIEENTFEDIRGDKFTRLILTSYRVGREEPHFREKVILGGAQLAELSDTETSIWIKLDFHEILSLSEGDIAAYDYNKEYYQRLIDSLKEEINNKFGKAETTKHESEIYIPTGKKKLTDWRKIWRKVKGARMNHEKETVLAKLGGVSVSTISKIIKAGDAELLE